MNSKFDFIFNQNNNSLLILIFENKYRKDDASISIDKDGFHIKYEDGDVYFENTDEDIFSLIQKSKSIYIIEIDHHQGKSKGNVKHNYKVSTSSL